MSVDAVQLVTDQLEPVLTLDTTIEDAIPRQVEAQIALHGWTGISLSDQRAVYVSVLATKALIPRLLLKFSQEVKKAKGGPAETEFMDAVEFLKALQAELTAQVRAAALEADPDDLVDVPVKRVPGTGIRGI